MPPGPFDASRATMKHFQEVTTSGWPGSLTLASILYHTGWRIVKSSGNFFMTTGNFFCGEKFDNAMRGVV